MPGSKSVLCLVMVGLLAGALVVDAQDNIKMCGRDLIRHAVSYCGNSRLRRAILKLEMPQQHAGDATPSALEDLPSDPASVLSESEDTDDMEALVSHWLPLSARMRRTALKISDLCCEKGCSKKELIQFC